jgi:hypothetical protein
MHMEGLKYTPGEQGRPATPNAALDKVAWYLGFDHVQKEPLDVFQPRPSNHGEAVRRPVKALSTEVSIERFFFQLLEVAGARDETVCLQKLPCQGKLEYLKITPDEVCAGCWASIMDPCLSDCRNR